MKKINNYPILLFLIFTFTYSNIFAQIDFWVPATPPISEYKVDLEINFENSRANDLAFFENKNGSITHVGILNGMGGIIHASGHVRLDNFTTEGITHSDTKVLTHKLSCIKRILN